MSDLNNIYWAIQALERSLDMLNEDCRANSNRADYVRQNKYTLENAKKSYDNIKKNLDK